MLRVKKERKIMSQERKPKEAGNAVGTTIILFAVIGIVLTVLLEIFAGNIAHLLQVPAEAYDKAVLYIRICSGGILVIIAYNVISGVLRGRQKLGIPSAFCIRIPVSILMAGLPETSLLYVGLATPITTVYGIIFFLVCFKIYGKKNFHKMKNIS